MAFVSEVKIAGTIHGSSSRSKNDLFGPPCMKAAEHNIHVMAEILLTFPEATAVNKSC